MIRILRKITSFMYAHLHINLYTVLEIIYWQNNQLLTFEQQYSTFALTKLDRDEAFDKLFAASI